MTPKIFPTEVKKPVSRLCRPGGKGGRNKKKKERGKKEKRSECAFPRFHTALPFILLLSLPLFIGPPPPISSFFSFFHSSPFSRLSPLDCAFFHHFSGSIDIDRLGTSSLPSSLVSPAVFTAASFLETWKFTPHAYRVRNGERAVLR